MSFSTIEINGKLRQKLTEIAVAAVGREILQQEALAASCLVLPFTELLDPHLLEFSFRLGIPMTILDYWDINEATGVKKHLQYNTPRQGIAWHDKTTSQSKQITQLKRQHIRTHDSAKTINAIYIYLLRNVL